jgi:hypothetical protein
MKFKIQLLVLALGLFQSVKSQNCQSNAYDWPSHKNWILLEFPSTWQEKGSVIDMTTMQETSIGKTGIYTIGYEASSIASDDNGKALFYTNGRLLWTGSGDSTKLAFDGLLAGNEGINQHLSSSAQGVITVRHPLQRNKYHVFTADDVIGPKIGPVHFTFDSLGQQIGSHDTLGDYKTFEGVVATKHQNGHDVWIVYKEHGTDKINAYLLTVDGINISKSNLSQAVGHPIVHDNARGGMSFSWDGAKLAITHPESGSNANTQVTLMDFDNATGTLSKVDYIGPVAQLLPGYDVTFSPNNKRLFISTQWHGVYMYNLDLPTSAEVVSSLTQIFSGSEVKQRANVEIGPGGQLYIGDYEGFKRVDGDLDSASQFTITTIGAYDAGLPTMYLPMADEPKIGSPGVLCKSAEQVDLNATWSCHGTSAEDSLGQFHGEGIVDTLSGMFDPQIAGAGVHNITYTYNNDYPLTATLQIVVSDTGSCLITDTKTAISSDLSIVPNPSLGTFWINSESEILEVLVYDLKGVFLKRIATNAEIKVQFTIENKGLYQVLINTKGGQHVRKVLVH